MALSDAYATAAEYRAQTDKSSTADDTTIASELTAVSRYIDKRLARPLGFSKDATAVARVYVMGRPLRIDVDDYVSVSSVEVGDHYSQVYDSALATSAYALLPRAAAQQPEPQPYRQIEFLTSCPGYQQLVRVTGIGGWPAVPPAIKTACIELTSILRLESARATNKVNAMDQVLSTSRVAQNIIDELLRVYRSKGSIL
jgi:hypothetical protein